MASHRELRRNIRFAERTIRDEIRDAHMAEGANAYLHAIRQRDAEAIRELREPQRLDALDARAEVKLDDDME